MILSARVLMISTDQVIGRTYIIPTISFGLQHVNVSAHRTTCSELRIRSSELLYQLSYVGEIRVRHYAMFPRSRKQIDMAGRWRGLACRTECGETLPEFVRDGMRFS